MDQEKKFFNAVICLIVIVIGAFIAGIIMLKYFSFISPLTVLGDVEKVLTVRDVKEIGSLRKTTFGKTSYKTVKLTELINKANPQGRVKKIFFVASDGFTSAIDADSLDQSYISFSQENGWIALNLHHPISSNVKMIQEIIIVCDSGSVQNCFTVVSGEKLLNYTVGQIYTGPIISYPYFEGQAVAEHKNIAYQSDVFTRRRVFQLGDLTSLNRGVQVMLWGEKGGYKLVDDSGYYELCGNHINYIQPETREELEMVRLAVINPPLANIMDTYYDALHYLENEKNVFVVMLSGFSYADYEYAVKKGCAPFFTENIRAVKSLGVYPIRANVWLAAMLTGLPPSENVLHGDDNNLPVNTLFTRVEGIGKKALLLTADNLLSVDAQITVRDDNASGSADDEIYGRLLKGMDDGYGIIMVQFDSIGASKAQFGKQSSQVENSIAQIDTYLNEIAGRWQGKIIVTAVPDDNWDTKTAFSRENLFVPYLLLSGKESETGVNRSDK